MKKKNNKNAFDPREDAKDKITLFILCVAIFILMLIITSMAIKRMVTMENHILIIEDKLNLTETNDCENKMNIPTYCNGTIIGINKGDHYDFYCEIK